MDKKHILLSLLIIIALVVPALVYKSRELRRSYKAEIIDGLNQFEKSKDSILTEDDIKDLPQPVQKYLRYTGVIGKEKVKNFRIVGEGEFKTAPDKEWVKAETEQYNFLDSTKRFYFIKLNMWGLPVVGLHVYKNATATMSVKIAGLFSVADAKGEIMNKAETVTVFNDMCLVAPASLIDERIEWETVDPLKVKAIFNNNGIRISADLFFNEKGELINFVSNDRYLTSTGKEYQNAPWSTPVREYKDYNDIKLASYGEAHWSLSEGDYCYGKINLTKIEYNVTDYQ
jgi:hypothetical protein